MASRCTLLIAVLAAAPVWGATFEGTLGIVKPGKGRVERSGSSKGVGSFSIANLELSASTDSDGIAPDTETVIVQVGSEEFLIPAGSFRASRNGRRFSYHGGGDRGVSSMTILQTPTGIYRARVALTGLNLIVVEEASPEVLPLCAWFGIRVGNDEFLHGLLFDMPKPAPSRRMTLPGSCTDISSAW